MSDHPHRIRSRRPARPRTLSDDRGSLSLAAAIVMPAVIVLFGLVVDGGYALAQRQRAIDAAQNAARAGANALAVDDLRRSAVRLDPTAAAAAARDYLTKAGYQATIRVTADRVTVTVRATQRLRLLAFIGMRSLEVQGVATARAVPGINGPNR